MTRMALPAPTLPTARLRLRPFADDDADALFALQSNAHVLRYWDAPPWTEPARAERFIAACRLMAEEGSGVRLAVDRAGDGSFIGWCSLSRWNPDFRSASLGYCFDAAVWGHGYATEAARGLLRWAFGTLDLNRVQAETDTRNLASARVLEKLGFMREGTLREDCVVNGEVSNSWVFGLLRRDWLPSDRRPVTNLAGSGIALRPATPADTEFCYQLHQAAMGEYVTAIWGWDEQDQRAFLDRAFNPRRWQIITVGPADIGMLDVEYRPGEIFLGRIEIDPAHQGRGFGSTIVGALIEEAEQRGQHLTLEVLAVNRRARALYERLGLTEVGRRGEPGGKVIMRSGQPRK